MFSTMARGERERTERALLESEAHYWELFENACDFVYTCDMQRRFTSMNKAGERLLGYSRDEFIGMSIAKIISPESLERSQQMRSQKEMGTSWTTYEVVFLTKEKRLVPIEVSTRIIYKDGKAVGVQGIGRDVTERKLAEEALKLIGPSSEAFARITYRGRWAGICIMAIEASLLPPPLPVTVNIGTGGAAGPPQDCALASAGATSLSRPGPVTATRTGLPQWSPLLEAGMTP